MKPRPSLPKRLLEGPFTIVQAEGAGVARDRLRSRLWRRLAPRVYAAADRDPDPCLLLETIYSDLPPTAAFSANTSAWLHGLAMEPFPPVDVSLPAGSNVSARVGLKVHRVTLEPGDVVRRQGLPATSMVRTIADLARQLPLGEAVAAADMALRQQLVEMSDLEVFVKRHARMPGTGRLRRVVELADGRAESPMETVLRLLLVRAGLPRPELQVDLQDSDGHFVGRADLYYPDHRLAIEYDGATHRDSLVQDDRRQNLILAAGYQLLRFTGADVLGNPAMVVAQVRAALASARRAA